MTQLTNLSPAASYGDVLTTTNNGQGLTTTLENLQDGLGNNSPVQIATNAINFNRTGGRTFQLDGIPLTVSANTLNNLQPTEVIGTLTPAQVYSMNGSSILLIGSPGLNSIIVINKFVLSIAFNITNYTNGGQVYLQYSQNSDPSGNNRSTVPISSNVILAGVSTMSTSEGTMGNLSYLASSIVTNSPICITNDTAAFATGDSNVNYYILYTTINLL